MEIVSRPQRVMLHGAAEIVFQCRLENFSGASMMDLYIYRIGFSIKVINTLQNLLLWQRRCNISLIWSVSRLIMEGMSTQKALTAY